MSHATIGKLKGHAHFDTYFSVCVCLLFLIMCFDSFGLLFAASTSLVLKAVPILLAIMFLILSSGTYETARPGRRQSPTDTSHASTVTVWAAIAFCMHLLAGWPFFLHAVHSILPVNLNDGNAFLPFFFDASI